MNHLLSRLVCLLRGHIWSDWRPSYGCFQERWCICCQENEFQLEDYIGG